MQSVYLVHAVEHAAVYHNATAADALLAVLEYEPQRNVGLSSDYACDVQQVGGMSVVTACVHAPVFCGEIRARRRDVLRYGQGVDIRAEREPRRALADVAINARFDKLRLVAEARELVRDKARRVIFASRRLRKPVQLAARDGQVFERRIIHDFIIHYNAAYFKRFTPYFANTRRRYFYMVMSYT